MSIFEAYGMRLRRRRLLARAFLKRRQLATVAEGVDAVDDWRLLQSFGCTQGQGWLIAPAMPGGELQAWAATCQERLLPLQAQAHASSP